MEKMIKEYRRVLEQLYARREALCREIGAVGRRLVTLDEEIDEMEEALMHMRPYVSP